MWRVFGELSFKEIGELYGKTERYVWVYYSMEAIDSNGDTVSASSRCEALWKVEKNEDGVWEVVSIREHP